jgi:hypothetical protein
MIKYLSSFILQRYKKFLVYLIFIIKIIMPTARPFVFDTGSYYMGFGVATGGANDNHELFSWSLTFT